MGKITFLIGFGAGYVSGVAAGRQRYEQIQSAVQSAYTNPTVQQYTSKAQTQAQSLLNKGKSRVSGQGGSRRSTGTSTYDVVEIPGGTAGTAGTAGTTGDLGTTGTTTAPGTTGTTTTGSTYGTGTTSGLGTTSATPGSLDPVASDPIDLGPDGTTGTNRPATGL